MIKGFNPGVVLQNIIQVKLLIQRMREGDSSVGSAEDELSLHRMLHDLDLLLDLVDGLYKQCKKTEPDDNTNGV